MSAGRWSLVLVVVGDLEPVKSQMKAQPELAHLPVITATVP